MTPALRTALLSFLRLPPAPDPPERGVPAQQFRAGRRYFDLKLLGWAVRQLVALGGLLFGVVIVARAERWGFPAMPYLKWAEIAGLVFYFVQLPVSWGILRLEYELRWYIVTPHSLRVREGILVVREQTVTFANIQNLSVRQGPLQRLLGIADLEVRTAGGGAGAAPGKGHQGGQDPHVAYFRGVAEPEQIRELLQEGIRRQRGAGLGDEQPAVDVADAVAGAAREAHKLTLALARRRAAT